MVSTLLLKIHCIVQAVPGRDGTKVMEQDGMGQEGIGLDRGWDRKGRGGAGRDGMGQERTGWDRKGRDGTGQDGMGQDGTGWDRKGRDRKGRDGTRRDRNNKGIVDIFQCIYVDKDF